MSKVGSGPLEGLRVLEIGGMGPGPFAGMTLADMGAEVVRIERPGGPGIFPGPPTADIVNRGKRSVVLDLKKPGAVDALLSLTERADALIEGYRPGVAERLGIGPAVCWERNPKLVYGRMTGWGQTGPLAQTAGHDISYIAITGALHAIGDAGGPPQVPVNLLGDYGGGGMYLVAGLLAALREADRTGRGQVVDAAIVDGTAHLLTGTHALVNAGTWVDERGSNLLDGGAPFYAVYETSDGRYMAAGALEPKFYAALLAGLGLTDEQLADQHDQEGWPGLRKRIAAAFASRTQQEWIEVFGTSDACVAPVIGMAEAADHPHVAARGAVVRRGDRIEPGVAPRFSHHPDVRPAAPVPFGRDTVAVLGEWGVDPAPLLESGAAAES
ncbi:CaiB/BaiF CoA-transferase family protein [Pseudonocardia xishanensis]|uniref:CaiB/BaiF CoA-transferase family protein n=1 Tax=Pseudonocardia xishanensis TaxID=630995 RepID=A0ABP8RT07_9PSEU